MKRSKLRRLITWVVGQSDFRRYFGWAVNRCKKGGVVFFDVMSGSRRRLQRFGRYCLSLAASYAAVLIAARADLEAGRYRRVILEKLPRQLISYERFKSSNK
jgi:hypothetical protein